MNLTLLTTLQFSTPAPPRRKGGFCRFYKCSCSAISSLFFIKAAFGGGKNFQQYSIKRKHRRTAVRAVLWRLGICVDLELELAALALLLHLVHGLDARL